MTRSPWSYTRDASTFERSLANSASSFLIHLSLRYPSPVCLSLPSPPYTSPKRRPASLASSLLLFRVYFLSTSFSMSQHTRHSRVSRTTIHRDHRHGSLKIVAPKPERHWSQYSPILDSIDFDDQFDNELREDDPVGNIFRQRFIQIVPTYIL